MQKMGSAKKFPMAWKEVDSTNPGFEKPYLRAAINGKKKVEREKYDYWDKIC